MEVRPFVSRVCPCCPSASQSFTSPPVHINNPFKCTTRSMCERSRVPSLGHASYTFIHLRIITTWGWGQEGAAQLHVYILSVSTSCSLPESSAALTGRASAILNRNQTRLACAAPLPVLQPAARCNPQPMPGHMRDGGLITQQQTQSGVDGRGRWRSTGRAFSLLK